MIPEADFQDRDRVSTLRRGRAGLIGLITGLMVAVTFAGSSDAHVLLSGAERSAIDPEQRIAELNKRSEAAFAKSDYVLAEKILRQLIEIDGDNFVPWYNLACALSMQDRTMDAGPALEKAIDLGFSDLGGMQSDPHLAAVRKTPNYHAIVASWDKILDARIESNLDAIRKTYGPGYTVERDESLRLAFVSAFSPSTFEQAKKDVRTLTAWWESNVAAPVTGPVKPVGSAGADTADRKPAPWVLVLLPSKVDYQEWAIARFGPRWQQIGGSYSHDEKKLVAKDLGSTLRHEYWHVLHWRDMTARRQQHPIWIMEGLCSLPEDVEPTADGTMKPIASWRTNQARKLAVTSKLMPWDKLFAMDQKRFIGERPLAYYAQARCVFLYLWHQGKLKAWYQEYTSGYADDTTGAAAMEKVFGKPLKDVQKDYTAWLRALPPAQEEFRKGDAVLPFDVEDGAGDGVVVSGSTLLERPQRKRSIPDRGGIRSRDVVTEIDGKPVRELGELIQVLLPYMPGTEVEVTYRRGKTDGTARVKLVPF